MLAGVMSPSRPWFALEPHDYELLKRDAVKQALWQYAQIARNVLNSSNFYGMASQLIGELLLYATAAMDHMNDFENVARFYTHTAGSYMIAQNSKYQIDTFIHEFEWSALQMAQEFGVENLSTSVRNALDNGNYDSWFPICRLVEPNDEYMPASPWARNQLFKDVYFEPGQQGADRDKFLRRTGHKRFPIHVPRWDTTGEDVYGTDCPGMTALGDIKELQIEEKRKAQAIDKMVRPVMKGPPSLRNVPIADLPGGVTIYDDGGGQKYEPAYQVNVNLQELRGDMDAVQRRIDQAFFVDLFRAISDMEGIQPRNELDLMQRNEERLLQLGPVLERLHSEFCDPLIEGVLEQIVDAGIGPPLPPELLGQPLKVRYISSLAMAQKSVGLQAIERLSSYAGSLLQLGFQVADKINTDDLLDNYADAVGAPPHSLFDEEQVQATRKERQEQLQRQQALGDAQQAAQVAQTASSAKIGNTNLLQQAIGDRAGQ
jgi:hypothetical protein